METYSLIMEEYTINSDNITNDSELSSLARLLLDQYKELLLKDNSMATGELYNKASQEIKVEGEHICIYFHLPEHWKYVEYGREPGGNFPPPDAILKWIEVKKIKLVPRAGQKKAPSIKLAAYLISRKIVREGIRPKNTLHNTLIQNELIINAFVGRLSDLLAEESIQIINTIYEDIK